MYRIIYDENNKVIAVADLNKVIDLYTTANFVDVEEKPNLKTGDTYQV